MKKKDVLFLCQFFYPEYNSSATLPWDLAQYLAHNGLIVGALCGYPREYTIEKKVSKYEEKNKVKIKRIKYIQLSRHSFIGRLINYFSFTLSSLLHVCELKKYKCVIVYSNPPILPIVAIVGNFLFRTKIIYVSFDVYPEIAFISRTIKKNSIIYKAMDWINKILFKKASIVVALTEEMKEFLLKNRNMIKKEKIVVIPNWAHENTFFMTKDILMKYGYTNEDFIISYFGNMGTCQEMDTLIKAIEILKNDIKIKFLFAGHGNKKEMIKKRFKQFNNVQIFDYLLDEEFEKALSISSCGIVSLEKGLVGLCAPSKYYSYLQAGLPIIAIVEQESYLAMEIRQHQIGKAVNINAVKDLVEIIKKYSENKEKVKELGFNSKRVYESYYKKNMSLEKYLNMIMKVVGDLNGK